MTQSAHPTDGNEPMGRTTLPAGTVLQMQGIPLALTAETTVETRPSNLEQLRNVASNEGARTAWPTTGN